MADKAKEDMIENFVRITDVDPDRARFYLESSAWNLELAMGSFYEGDPEDDELVAVGQSINQSANPMPDPSDQDFSAPGGSSGRRKASPAKKTNPKFATIGSMNAEDSDDSSDDEGQAFYAGGSERSGQQILGPNKKKDVVGDLFKSARDHGAEEMQDQEQARPRRGPAFKGSGYRLGDQEGSSSEMIAGAPQMAKRKQVDCVLKLWKDGFSIDDGPLRDFKDKANQAFMASISKGEVPQELIRGAKGGEINLVMKDHRQEEYVKPKVSTRAFTGEGHTLGSPAPTVVESMSTQSSPAAAQSTLQVDDSKPSTTIQIRLADGTRLVQKFNLTHTVCDIRKHITSSRPQYASASFILQTTFPNRELSNDSESVETAKLQNAVVVQRMQ